MVWSFSRTIRRKSSRLGLGVLQQRPHIKHVVQVCLDLHLQPVALCVLQPLGRQTSREFFRVRRLGSVLERSQKRGRPDLVISPRRVVVQASTGELLRCLSDFLCRRCVKVKELSSNQIVLWFRNVDRALLVQGWQDQCFISPASLVFVYLLCREAVDEDTSSEQELHATFLTCLYLAYSYLGNEISYPLKPFLVESSRDAFWERALELIERLSDDMLRINADPHFFTEVFQDLKNQGGVRERQRERERERGCEKEERRKEKEMEEEEKEEDKENDEGNRIIDLDR
ncbi:hypothetical protein INR49_010358 [Caranx melampygus]|nr:hypothetical protein INR49_010358 [Caranx melampygus]